MCSVSRTWTSALKITIFLNFDLKNQENIQDASHTWRQTTTGGTGSVMNRECVRRQAEWVGKNVGSTQKSGGDHAGVCAQEMQRGWLARRNRLKRGTKAKQTHTGEQPPGKLEDFAGVFVSSGKGSSRPYYIPFGKGCQKICNKFDWFYELEIFSIRSRSSAPWSLAIINLRA